MFWKRPLGRTKKMAGGFAKKLLTDAWGFPLPSSAALRAIRKCDVPPSPMIDEPVRIRRGPYGALVRAMAASPIGGCRHGLVGRSSRQRIAAARRSARGCRGPAVSQEQIPQPADVPPGAAASYPARWWVVSLVDSTVTSSQWAYLDHDAPVAWKPFAELMPLRPTPQRSTH